MPNYKLFTTQMEIITEFVIALRNAVQENNISNKKQRTVSDVQEGYFA